MYILEIKAEKLHEDAILPVRQTKSSAGADLHAYLHSTDTPGYLTIAPGETCKVGTGIAIALPENVAGFVFARSGLATKQHLAPANKVGVIDEDYRGEILVALHNHGSEAQTILHGERIAQFVALPYLPFYFSEADSIGKTGRGSGGFGSTGAE